jgi:hypothetical protein
MRARERRAGAHAADLAGSRIEGEPRVRGDDVRAAPWHYIDVGSASRLLGVAPAPAIASY